MFTLHPRGKNGIELAKAGGDYRVLHISELLNRRICAGKIKDRIGKLSDLVFHLVEPFPQVVGIYIEHGWGKPTEFVPWEKVVRLEDDAIFVQPAEGGAYPPFVDQPGWILADQHLMGRTILDLDGRRCEVVNDVLLIETKGRLLIADVDISFNGFLRRVGLGRFSWIRDRLISWKYVQPLSVEDVVATDKVSLSLTRKQVMELPSEDLADVLEELQGEEQEALFGALDSEKAAETLAEAEPRAKRQLVEDLSDERAREIFSEMTVAQLADLFAVLPFDEVQELLELLNAQVGEKVRSILSDPDPEADDIMSQDYVTLPKEARASEVFKTLRQPGREPRSISYVYVVNDDDKTLIGVVDLRELTLAPDETTLGDIMVSPVVTADKDASREGLIEMFIKYHYRMIPIVDAEDKILGVVSHNDIMKGVVLRAKD
ncbi:MAG: CBS domain-containing protein [Syntrophobacteraceae bacterium]|nr:CBS domain-containing protein [Syntrophobacteraceae bacterium]